MIKISLRKIKLDDKNYFAEWWRDKELLKLTSGILRRISDKEVDKYFQGLFKNKKDHHFMIVANKKTIGHASLVKRKNNWYETRIIIGEKKYLDKGYGQESIKLLFKEARRLGVLKIYLEVRPTNTRAIRAYEQCGFEKVKIIKYPENNYLSETLRMELLVS